MKPIMNLTSPWRDDQSQRFMTTFRNFKNQSLCWILKTNHSILWQYLGILKSNHGVLWLYLGILTIPRNFKNQSHRSMTIFKNFKNQSHRFMTIFTNFINQGVTSHSKIKTLRYFRLRSTALARNTTRNSKNGLTKNQNHH